MEKTQICKEIQFLIKQQQLHLENQEQMDSIVSIKKFIKAK